MALDHVLAREGSDDDEFAKSFLASGGIVSFFYFIYTFLLIFNILFFLLLYM